MIFSRRTIQRRLDELRYAADARIVDALVQRLNRPGKDRFAAMWEVVILHALAPLGTLEVEIEIASGKRPDLKFTTSVLSFTADITTVSDEGLDEQNPYRDFSELIEALKTKLGLKVGGTDIRIKPQRITTARGTKARLRLPPRNQLRAFVRDEIEPVLRQQLAEGRSVLHVAFDDERAGLQITIDPAKSPYNSSSFASYSTPTIKDKNPLYAALRSKAVQLKGAGGLAGVIVGDGATRSLADRPSHWSEVTAREIANEFLRQHSSVSFVLLLSVREERTSWLHIGRPTRKLHALLEFSKTQTVPSELETLFREMMENMPKPISMPSDAALRAREARYDWGHHGGGTMSGKSIKISAREVMEVLAGQRTVKQMNSHHRWFLSDDKERENKMQNPFERWLAQGRLPSAIAIEKTDEDDSDDWIEIEIGDPDPAISPFR